jgi:hypothetical protein
MDTGQTQSDDNNAVDGVYNLLRTTRFRSEYYAEKMAIVSRKNLLADVLLAVAVPSSAVAGLPFLGAYYGAAIWGLLTGLASVVSVLKPVLGFGERIKRYGAAAGMYRDFYGQLSTLSTEISQKHNYDETLQTRFLGIQTKMFDESKQLNLWSGSTRSCTIRL